MHILLAVLVLLAVAPLPAQTGTSPQEELPVPAGESLRSGDAVPPGAVAVIDGTPVSVAAFIDEMIARYLRPNAEGHKVLETLEQEALIKLALERRGLDVTEQEVLDKVKALAEQLQSKTGRSLEQTLRESRVSMDTFHAKTRGVVALEKLARLDLNIPAEKPVEPYSMNLWLKQARGAAAVERDPAKLPPDVLCRVDTEPVSRIAFVRNLLLTLEPAEVRRNVDTLLQEIVGQHLLAANNLTLTEADVMAEWLWKKKAFESDPLHTGITFEEIVKQQTGLTPEEFRKTRGFRVNAALGRMARSLYTTTQVAEAFERHKDLYGPRLHVRHILVRATDHPNAKGKVRTIAEGLELARFIVGKLREGAAFEDLARQYSEDLGTKLKGGVVPPFTSGRNNYERSLVEASQKLQPYEVSEPVQGNSGWHVIRLDSVDPLPPVAEVEEDLRRVMASETFRDAFKKARIGVDVRL